MNKNNPQLFEPYRLNITSGRLQQIAENTNIMEPLDSWMTDHEGKVRIASKVTGGTNTTLLYRRSEDEPLREVLTTDFREGVQPLFFDFDNGDVVYVSSNLNRDKNVIIRFDMQKGEEIGEPIFEHPEVDVSTLTYSKKRKVLTVVSYNTEKTHFHFLDAERESIQKRLEEKLGAYEVFVTLSLIHI